MSRRSRQSGPTRHRQARFSRKRVRYLEALFHSLESGICFLDRRLRVVDANPAMRQLRAAAGTDGQRPCPEVAREIVAPCLPCLAADALASRRTMRRETEEPCHDGETRWLESIAHPLLDSSGNPFGVAEVVRDITWRGRVQRDIALANQDIEMLLGSIRSILVTLDGDNRIRRFNASAETVFGLSGDAVRGRDFFAVGLKFEDTALSRGLAVSRSQRTPVRLEEIRCRTPDGAERLLGLTINPVPMQDGRSGTVPGVLILGRDLAAIQARQLQDSHERRMQAIGRLASGIAHEINTPVQYLGYNAGFLNEAFASLLEILDAYRHVADLADDGGPVLAEALRQARRRETEADLDYLRQEVPQAIANSRKGIRQVTEIVTAMRQMAHPGSGDRLFFDINAAVRDIVTVTRNAWKSVAEVELTLDASLPLVYGLPQEVSQVLLNVILNAAQAVEEQVTREPWTRGRITITTSLVEDRVVVAVADTGPGIAEEIRGRIFDPFFTTKDVGKGTGQGLAISQAVMGRHGGEIDCSSRPGEGATFFLRFPAGGATDAGSAEPRETP